MKKLLLPACALVLSASTAGADVISDWNIQTGQRIAASTPPRRGPSGVLDFAVVHLAMHDAVQAFARRHEAYCVAVPNASGSPVAAVSQAARDVLVGLFPAQIAAIDAAHDTLTATDVSQGLMVQGDEGALVGTEAAASRTAEETASARMFALVATATADAIIACWGHEDGVQLLASDQSLFPLAVMPRSSHDPSALETSVGRRECFS